MAKQIEGVYERVVECAKEEFLEKGFKDASLRTIAAKAETSTGSIYTRFGDKEGLFRSIVDPVADRLKKMFMEMQEEFHQKEEQVQKEIMVEYSSEGQHIMLDYIYDHFEEFKLLLECSYGTEHQNFVDELVQIEVEYTYKYMEVIGSKSVKNGLVTEEFIHIITTAYFNGMFDVVRRNMEKEAAVRYVDMLERYHAAGFDTIFEPEKYSI